jgi:4-carboxymuconolactone decarboxylase
LPEPQPSTPAAGAPAAPRVAPLESEQRTAEQRELLMGPWGEDVPNLFSTVARHPALYRAWIPFCMQLLMHSVFPPRERELLIIRTASLCGSDYELVHHLRLAAEMGLSDRDLDALTGKGPGDWNDRDRLLVAAADELHADHVISEATWQGLSPLLTTEQLVELTMLVGHYILLAGMLRSLGVSLESERVASGFSAIGAPIVGEQTAPKNAR